MPTSTATPTSPLTPITAPAPASLQDSIANINKGIATYNASQASASPTKVTEPTTLTNATVSESKIPDNQSKLAAASQGTGMTTSESGHAVTADSQYAQAPSNATQNPDGSWTANGVNYLIGPSSGLDESTQKILDQMKSLKAQMDATGAANIGNIQAQYENLIKQQQDINTRQTASTETSLMRAGSLRYSTSSQGLVTGVMNAGLQAIADLQTKENAALIAAQQANENNDQHSLDTQLSIYDEVRKEKQAQAQKLSDNLLAASQKMQAQREQATKDNAIQSVLASGVTDPSQILAELKKQGYDTINSKDIADTISNLNPDAKEIHTMMTEAAKFAPADVLAKAGQSKTVGEALGILSPYLLDPTSTAGQYKAAVAAGYQGTPGDYLAAQKYKDAYNAASASERAKSAFANSSANQQKLFQEGVSTLKSEMSNRSGGLGLQDAKVNQAIHLKALFDQYKQTITVPNPGGIVGGIVGKALGVNNGTHQEVVYNIPAVQYSELAMGLANLVSGSNQVSDSAREAITQKTAAGDFKGAITYITGVPQNGTTQDVLRNIKDSIDRQGTVAEQERQTYIDNLIARLPPDLNPELRDQLVKSAGLNSYTDPSPAQMTPVQIDSNAFDKIQKFSEDPKNAALLAELGRQFPNLSNVEMAQKLGLMQ